MLIAASVMNRAVRVGRHVHEEHMADPARGAQAGLLGHDRAHQLVRVQAALHQELGPAGANQLDGLGRGGVAVRRVDELVAAQISSPNCCGHVADLGRRPDQDRDDQPWQRQPRPRRAASSRRMDAPPRTRSAGCRAARDPALADSCRAAGRWPRPARSPGAESFSAGAITVATPSSTVCPSWLTQVQSNRTIRSADRFSLAVTVTVIVSAAYTGAANRSSCAR